MPNVQLQQILRNMLANQSVADGEFVRITTINYLRMEDPVDVSITLRRYHRDQPSEEVTFTMQELFDLITED